MLHLFCKVVTMGSIVKNARNGDHHGNGKKNQPQSGFEPGFGRRSVHPPKEIKSCECGSDSDGAQRLY